MAPISGIAQHYRRQMPLRLMAARSQ